MSKQEKCLGCGKLLKQSKAKSHEVRCITYRNMTRREEGAPSILGQYPPMLGIAESIRPDQTDHVDRDIAHPLGSGCHW